MSGNIFHWAVCPAMRMVTWFSSCPPGSLVSGPKSGGKDWEKGQSGAKIQLTLLLKKDKWKTKMIGSGLLFWGHRSTISQREWQMLFCVWWLCWFVMQNQRTASSRDFATFCRKFVLIWSLSGTQCKEGLMLDIEQIRIYISVNSNYINRMAFDMNKRLE